MWTTYLQSAISGRGVERQLLLEVGVCSASGNFSFSLATTLFTLHEIYFDEGSYKQTAHSRDNSTIGITKRTDLGIFWTGVSLINFWRAQFLLLDTCFASVQCSVGFLPDKASRELADRQLVPDPNRPRKSSVVHLLVWNTGFVDI